MTTHGRFWRLRETLRDKAICAQRALMVHSVTFASINGVLMMINAVTGDGPWFLISFAVGAGSVAVHAVHATNCRRAAFELAAVRYLNDRQVELVRQLQKSRARLRSHGAIAAATPSASVRRLALSRGTAYTRPSR